MSSFTISRRGVLKGASAFGVLTAFGCASAPWRARSGGLADWDAVETAGRIASGEISAVETIEAAIARAEASDAALNAIVTPTFETARARAATPLAGALAGVPTFVKDLEDVAGVPTGYGSRAFAGYIAERDTGFVEAFFGAGVVSLGKSATPEFGLTASTEPRSSGPARNPWNLDRSAGGSSGGAAALVAAGVVPMAHASDGGGSIRIPASSCGLVGLKVSRGRLRGDPPGAQVAIDFAVDGVETRTVRDTAAFIAAVERQGADAPLPPVGRVEGPSSRVLRAVFFTDAGGAAEVNAEVAAATRAAASACEELGHAVTEIAYPYDAEQFGDDFLLFWASGARGVVADWEARTGLSRSEQAFEPWTLGLVDHAESNIDEVPAAIRRLRAFEGDYARMMEGFDVLISPVLSAPPPPIGYLAPDLPYGEHYARVIAHASFTGFQNIAGAPAISLPLAMSSDGLPIGVQFAGAVGAERTLLELAYALEEARPWADRRPALWTG